MDVTIDPFDVTRNGTGDTSLITERSLVEAALSNTVVEESDTVVYEVVEEGTIRKMKKLVSSDGFSYCVKIRQEAVRDLFAPASRLVDDKMLTTFETTDFNLPRPTTLVRQINRAREKIRPKEPKSLDFEVNTEFLIDPFLVGDVRVGDERHLMFATDEQLQILNRSRKWYLDGTFRVVRKPFTQLWSIHAFIRHGETMKQVPLLFVLMSRRRKQDYVAVLNQLLTIIDDTPLVESFTMDFESALWQALKEVFPSASLHGCGFHWAQAVQRRVKEVGLQTTYQQREGVHRLIRKLLAIPFLPACDIPRAFQKLSDKAKSSEPLRAVFQYVNDQWLESSIWSPEQWTVYRQSVRTNNDTEGWHRRINAKAGRGALPMYVLLMMLLQEAKLVNINVHLILDHSVGRRRRPTYLNMNSAIFDLWDLYDDHDILCEDFLRQIGDIWTVINVILM